MTRMLLLAALAALAVVPAANAEQLHANVDAWTPNDVRPGEPVYVVFQLYTSGGSPYPRDGIPATGIDNVEIVMRGEGVTRRFSTVSRGRGRYDAQIVFPSNGGWELRVSYGAGSEIPLGKSGICVGAPICVDEPPAKAAPNERDHRPWIALALAAGLALMTASSYSSPRRRRSRRSRVFGSRRSPRRSGRSSE